ncbi:MAG: EAL domain-containing protein [Lachnospiraceae bacterium]|nr:EAL domain-containing protein [Lachnospiraceae bacterium]
MAEEIYYNLSAIFLLIIITASLLYRKMTKGRSNVMYLYLILFTIAASVLNTAELLIDGDPSYSANLKLVLLIAYYICRNLSFGAYGLFVISICDVWHKLADGITKYLLFVPVIITSILALSSLFLDYAFYIDKQGYFVRGEGILIFYFCNTIYGICAFVAAGLYRKNIGIKKTVALLSCAVAALFSYVFGLAVPYYHFDLLAYTLGIIFIILLVLNPESRYDSQSDLIRYEAYIEDVKKSFVSQKPLVVIQINVNNYPQMAKMLSYDRLSRLIKKLSSRLSLMAGRLNLSCELYYIKEGRFRVILNPDSFYEVDKASRVFNNIFNEQTSLDEFKIELNSTVCISRCPEDFDSFDTLYDFEDTLFSYENSGEVIRAEDLIKDYDVGLARHLDEIIENALNNNKFEVYYQPIYNSQDHCFDSAEALLRLRDDTYGVIDPSVFIPAAEKTGSIDKIGDYVLNEVCKFISSSDFKHLNLKNIEINVSVIQCLNKSFFDKTVAILNKYSVKPEQLIFEIKESVATESSQKIFFDNVFRFAMYGIGVALDEFGTGYSNIATITALPLCEIKFDRTFVNTGNNDKLEVVLRNTLDMVRSLDKKIVIEGVEDIDTARKFEFLGCNYMQGFYFSEPIPKDELVWFLNGR